MFFKEGEEGANGSDMIKIVKVNKEYNIYTNNVYIVFFFFFAYQFVIKKNEKKYKKKQLFYFMYFFILQLCFLNIKATNTADEYKLFLDEELGITEENFNQEKYEEILKSLEYYDINETLVDHFNTCIFTHCRNQKVYIEKQIAITKEYKIDTITIEKLYIIFKKTNTSIYNRIYYFKRSIYELIELIVNKIKTQAKINEFVTANGELTTPKKNEKYDKKISEHKTLHNVRKYLNMIEPSFKTMKNVCNNSKIDRVYINNNVKCFITCLNKYNEILLAVEAKYDKYTQMDDCAESIASHSFTDPNVQFHNVDVDQNALITGKMNTYIDNSLQPLLTKVYKNDNEYTNRNNSMIQSLQTPTNVEMSNDDGNLFVSNDENITIVISENMRNTCFKNHSVNLSNYENYIIELENAINTTNSEDLKGSSVNTVNIIDANIITNFEVQHIILLIDCVYESLYDALQGLNVANKIEYINTVKSEYSKMIDRVSSINSTDIEPKKHWLCNDKFISLKSKFEVISNLKTEIMKIIEISRFYIHKHIAGIKINYKFEVETNNDEYTSNPDCDVPHKKSRMS